VTPAQHIVRDIRDLLQYGMKEDADRVMELWTRLAEACDGVNERFRRCEEYLERDLRDEAVREALAEPPLLQEFDALNFPEIGEWEQVLAAHDLVSPLPQPSESTERLGTAILEPLLGEYRKAVRNNNTRDRVNILRQIRRIEPSKPSWKEDLEGVERLRQEQIESEARVAFEETNEEAVKGLFEELESPDWLSPPQGDLVDSLRIYINRLRSERLTSELESLAAKLNEAYGAFDYDAASEPVNRWREIMGDENFKPPDRVIEQTQDILEWYSEEEKKKREDADYQRAVKALTVVLDKRLPRAVLQDRWNAVERFGREVPETLAMQYERRKELLDLEASRKLRMKIILISLSAVAVIALIAWFTHSSLRQRALNTWVAKIEKAVNEKEYGQARQLLAEVKKNDPETFKNPQIQALKADVESKELAEKKRRQNFESALELARQTDLSDPDIEQRFDTAEKLAASSLERLQVEELKTKHSAHLREEQRKKDDLFKEELNRVREEIQKMANISAETESDLYRQRLDKIKTETEELKSWKDISKGIHSQVGPLEVRIEALETTYNEAQQRRLDLMNVHDSIGKEEFFATLEKYGKEYTRSQRGKDFLEVSRHKDAFLAVDDWSAIIKGSDKFLRDHENTKALFKNDPEEANTKFSNEFGMYDKHGVDYPNSVYAEGLKNYKAYWERFKSACTDNRAKSLLKLLNSKSIKGTLMVETKEGKRYYCRSFKRKENSDKYIATVLHGGEMIIGEYFRKEDLKAMPGPSPQAMLADELKEALLSYPTDDWDTFFLELAKKCLEWKDLDPVLKTIISTYLLDLARLHCAVGRARIEKVLESIEEIQTDVAWLEPDNKKAEEARREATKGLAKITPDMDSLIREVRAGNLVLVKSMSRPLKRVGILLKDKGKWKVVCPRGLGADAREFWILETDEVGQGKGFVVAARRESGEIVIDDAAMTLFVEGLPVFVPADNKTTNEFLEENNISEETLKRCESLPACWPKEKP